MSADQKSRDQTTAKRRSLAELKHDLRIAYNKVFWSGYQAAVRDMRRAALPENVKEDEPLPPGVEAKFAHVETSECENHGQ